MARLAALMVGLALLTPASAFAQPQPLANCGGTWTSWPSSNPETIWQLSTSATSNDLSNPQAAAMLNAGFDEWAEPGCTSFNAAQGGDTSASPMNTQDSTHTIGTLNSGWPYGPSTLAVTTPAYFSDCELASSDMVFNGQDHDWVDGSPNEWWESDFEAVGVHEIGHWIGFDHNVYPGSSLNASYSGGTAERTLTCSDTEGVCYSYSSGGNSCSADRYCACNVSCSGDVCGGGGGDDDDDDDDDDAPIGTCGSGTPQAIAEQEPNDWQGENDVNYFEASGADLTFTGSLTCGNNGQQYTSDIDWVVLEFPCTGTGRFGLDWNTNSLMDFYVWGTSAEEAIASVVAESVDPPFFDDAAAGGQLFVAIACWDGASGDYEFTVDWSPFGSSGDDDDDDDDDDGAQDDDDASQDDDDASDDDDDDGGGRVGSVRTGCQCTTAPAPIPLALWVLALSAVSAGVLRRRL